ncbi:hypothetical protein ILUMI_01714 [Ignelater luminosus]|uniref:Fatty acyl-CoA reductase n=1 Tax=Ignelater luminosus TaxID=2038154 RepID=A0A8K0DHZ6_IGNLU|nr:hypothetical protein ILUMI_01714 [Ignelater luminosus]
MEYIYPVESCLQKVKDNQNSEIQDYFAGSTVFVTGATGFLGRLLVEKLLRSCRDLKRVYILVRQKKDKTPEERFKEYFDNVIYDPIKREYPKALEKVFILSGDCALPDLGLNEKDKETFLSEVDCIFHAAATVRFDEKIRIAAYINVRATRDLIKLAKQVKHLKSFVHVSTAYSFCTQPKIDEKFYDSALNGEQLLTLVEIFDEDKLEEMTPLIIGKWPNTYVFTKSIAENVVGNEAADLPLAIVRPSIVVATANEPIPGWIDNFYGATGVIAGAGLGIIRTLHCKPNNLADLVPADYVINAFIAAAWEVSRHNNSRVNEIITGSEKEDKRNNESDIPIYNYVCSPQKPFTWRECMDTGFKYGNAVTSVLQVWHHCLLLNPNRYVHLFFHYLLHVLPAYIVDFFAMCVGKQPQLVKGYAKIAKFVDVIAFFSTKQWLFINQNTQELWNSLSSQDKKLFNFDMGSFCWDAYFSTYISGIRVYVVKDPMETVPQGLVKAFRLKLAHYILVTVLLLGFFKFLLYFLF